MPEWNKIVDDFQAEYGDQVQFLKVDGNQDRYTADRYNIESFPSFIIIEPNTFGDAYNQWRPAKRSYAAMK